MEVSMKSELIKYIEENIYPLYEKNDWAHQLWHIREVVERSLRLAKNYPVNKEMVYVIASFHDLGCHIDRENHEKISAELMENDPFIQKYFTADDVQIMKEAIVDHRGSLEYEPRSIYGKIIASADRFTTIEGILRSTHSYTLEFYPDVPWEEMIQISYSYIKKKYGQGGYAKSPIPNPEFEQFLIDVNRYLDDSKLFSKKLEEIDRFLRDEYSLDKR